MNPDETEHRTPEEVIASNWRLQCCAICDKDRVGDEPGDVHAGDWICWACLEAAPWNWRLQCCAICDKDRVGDEPGDVHAGDWICWACLEAAPCDKCDGEHNPLGPCPADATNGQVSP